jgi:S-(hydroxymethyl)glutathione dehydrogenase / alcohol dehydrogenase
MRAALLTALNAPLELAEVAVCPPCYGQVQVRVICSGVCGAQLQEIRGEKGGPLPHLMGHEGCGIVTDIGPGVTRVKRGDKVVLHWRQAAGVESDFPVYFYKGRPITSGKCVSLAEMVTVSENRCTPVQANTPPELAALLGCGLSTALGTIENESGLKGGQSVLIIGVGGLGANLIRAAKLAHVEVTACDCAPGKGALARLLGADTYTEHLDSLKHTFDCVIDTTGHPSALAAGITKLAPSGRCVMVGQPAPGADVPMLNARHLFAGEGKTITATQGGAHTPHLDIPRYVRMYQSGALNLDHIISHRLPLDRVNEAFDLMRVGEAGRVLIEMDNA